MALVRCLNCKQNFDHEGEPQPIQGCTLSVALFCIHCGAYGYVVRVVPEHKD